MPPLPHFSINILSLLILMAHSVSNQTRPSYHITPQAKWMNDPQRAVFIGGEWHLYYLWNSHWNVSDPGTGGTEWYHLTSPDMVTWADQGVVIEKYQPNPPSGEILGDIESGSAVVDTANTAGFGQDALVAVLTQMQDGVQQQSLFFSTDSGYSFTPFEGNPVMPNPDPDTKPAFRDPKVFWDDEAGRWVAAITEGSQIAFYSSADLRSWTYLSTFSPTDLGVDLGVLECPDVFQIDLDGDPSKRTWILATSANGYLHGKTTGTVYWKGTWDGAKFTTPTNFPQWMDEGPDFYAAVSWENPDDQYGSRYCIGWMNNWEYADTLPYHDDYQGQQSLVRELKLRTISGNPTLVSSPIAGYDALFADPVSITDTDITTDPATAALPTDISGGAYVIHATVTKGDGDDGSEVRFRIKSDGSYHTTVAYDFSNSQAAIVRSSDGSAADVLAPRPKEVWDAIRTASNPEDGNSVNLTIYADWNSVEVFLNGGTAAISALIYPNQGAEGIEVVSSSGKLTLNSFSYAGYAT